jgi:hypothetical protein
MPSKPDIEPPAEKVIPVGTLESVRVFINARAWLKKCVVVCLYFMFACLAVATWVLPLVYALVALAIVVVAVVIAAVLGIELHDQELRQGASPVNPRDA